MASTITTMVHTKVLSACLPSFSDTPSESYLELKGGVQSWVAGESGQLVEDVMGPRYSPSAEAAWPHSGATFWKMPNSH